MGTSQTMLVVLVSSKNGEKFKGEMAEEEGKLSPGVGSWLVSSQGCRSLFGLRSLGRGRLWVLVAGT